MFPTRSYTASGQSTHASCTRTQPRPSRAATAATWRVWFDWTPPIETSVSQPWARASAARNSSFRVLLPPNASPLETSSRFAQTVAPPSSSVSRSSRCTGEGPKSRSTRGNRSRSTVVRDTTAHRGEEPHEHRAGLVRRQRGGDAVAHPRPLRRVVPVRGRAGRLPGLRDQPPRPAAGAAELPLPPRERTGGLPRAQGRGPPARRRRGAAAARLGLRAPPGGDRPRPRRRGRRPVPRPDGGSAAGRGEALL